MGNFWPVLLAISLPAAQFCLYVFLFQTPAGAVQTSLQILKDLPSAINSWGKYCIKGPELKESELFGPYMGWHLPLAGLWSSYGCTVTEE